MYIYIKHILTKQLMYYETFKRQKIDIILGQQTVSNF